MKPERRRPQSGKAQIKNILIIRARPYGSGFYGLRYASEHPADGSPSGPANPSRVFFKILRLEIGIDGFGVKKHVAS